MFDAKLVHDIESQCLVIFLEERIYRQLTISVEPTQKENIIKNQKGWSKTWKTQPVKVSSMSPGQREVLEQNLKSAEEVACTLVYEDGWSLLRANKQQVCYIVLIVV